MGSKVTPRFGKRLRSAAVVQWTWTVAPLAGTTNEPTETRLGWARVSPGPTSQQVSMVPGRLAAKPRTVMSMVRPAGVALTTAGPCAGPPSAATSRMVASGAGELVRLDTTTPTPAARTTTAAAAGASQR